MLLLGPGKVWSKLNPPYKEKTPKEKIIFENGVLTNVEATKGVAASTL